MRRTPKKVSRRRPDFIGEKIKKALASRQPSAEELVKQLADQGFDVTKSPKCVIVKMRGAKKIATTPLSWADAAVFVQRIGGVEQAQAVLQEVEGP